MLSIKEGLHFDAAQAVNEIEQFVRSEVHRLGKRGVVLGLSGGLDSTTCAYLCVRALGERMYLPTCFRSGIRMLKTWPMLNW